MTTQFLQDNLWDKLHSFAKRATRKYVATAYLGKGATKLLPLSQGDVLVVDLREGTVRAGQVNPYEIEEYISRGVEVHAYSNLHAKVFIFDRKAIIASANVSSHSKNSLIECGVLVTDEDVVNAARGFVISLMGAPVTPAYAKSLKKYYHPPKIKGTPSGKRDTQNRHPSLWIERVEPCDFDKKENHLVKTGMAVAKKMIKNKKTYEIDTIRYGVRFGVGQRAKPGDLMIQIWKDEDEPLLVYPPSRIIYERRYTNSHGAKRKLIFVEEPRNPQTIDWKIFKQKIKKLGVTRVHEMMEREISNPSQKQALLGLWITQHK